MRVYSTPSFNKDISKLRDAKLAAQVERIILKMQAAEQIQDIAGVKKLAGATNAYRVRFGDYRLGFTVSSSEIRLVVFAHRREIYRYFP